MIKDMMAVAEKEIRDYFTGKRFLALFTVVMLLCIAGMVLGISSYNSQIESYKTAQASQAMDQYYQHMIMDQQKLIADAEARGESQEIIDGMRATLETMTNPPMPSVLMVFNGIGAIFVTVGALLSIVMGFNVITRERETGTLKLLLTRPTYRDSVINGKALAGFVTITTVFGAAFLITLAIMLLYNVVPGADDLARLVVLFIVALLYMLLFFGLSMLISALSPSSTISILASVGLFILATVLLGVGSIAGYMLAGPMPEYPAVMAQGLPVPENVNASSGARTDSGGFSYYMTGYNESDPQVIAYRQAAEDYDKELKAYYQHQQQISDVISLISPIGNFYKLNDVIVNKYAPGQQSYGFYGSYFYTYGTSKELNIFESLSYRWTYLLIFIAEIIAAFGLSYMLFMRADVT